MRGPRCRQGPTRHGRRGVNRQRPVVAVLAGSGQAARHWRRLGFGRRKARTRVRDSVRGPRARACRTGALWQGDRPVPQGGPDRRRGGRPCVGHGRLGYAWKSGKRATQGRPQRGGRAGVRPRSRARRHERRGVPRARQGAGADRQARRGVGVVQAGRRNTGQERQGTPARHLASMQSTRRLCQADKRRQEKNRRAPAVSTIGAACCGRTRSPDPGGFRP